MANYKANKNLTLKTPGIYVAEGEIVELEPVYAEQVNKDLKLTFPDVDAVLVPVDTTESVEVEQPKKTTRKKKADDTETVEDAAE
ncbi:TPA: hypothetical protein U1W51_000907 [Streptococcus suis]|nr:hypothetical protein [Streptococcus suis]HEM4137340.1 hypothetical protein [Streptococcus suis]